MGGIINNKKSRMLIGIAIIGLILVIIGICIKMPGDYLTTYSLLDGEKSKNGKYYYSSIEEYVGGDAYNYIIGASLIGGKIAGTMSMKSIFIAGGILVICIALIQLINTLEINKEKDVVGFTSHQVPISSSDSDKSQRSDQFDNQANLQVNLLTENATEKILSNEQ
ncbi:MAG: hypothetical protein K2F65_07615 [Eubacterium sp.]|nr:hypothetical protein [Eubacterium sp.]